MVRGSIRPENRVPAVSAKEPTSRCSSAVQSCSSQRWRTTRPGGTGLRASVQAYRCAVVMAEVVQPVRPGICRTRRCDRHRRLWRQATSGGPDRRPGRTWPGTYLRTVASSRGSSVVPTGRRGGSRGAGLRASLPPPRSYCRDREARGEPLRCQIGMSNGPCGSSNVSRHHHSNGPEPGTRTDRRGDRRRPRAEDHARLDAR